MGSVLWLAVLGSTLSWAAFDAVRKKLVTKIPVAALAFWIALAQVPGYAIWAALEGRWLVGSAYYQPAAISFALNLLANVLFLESVRRGPLSVAIPVLSFTPVFAALGGIPLLGERLGVAQWLGVAVVSGASVFLTAEPGIAKRPDLLISRFARTAGVPQMFGVAILWALTPLFDNPGFAVENRTASGARWDHQCGGVGSSARGDHANGRQRL